MSPTASNPVLDQDTVPEQILLERTSDDDARVFEIRLEPLMGFDDMTPMLAGFITNGYVRQRRAEYTSLPPPTGQQHLMHEEANPPKVSLHMGDDNNKHYAGSQTAFLHEKGRTRLEELTQKAMKNGDFARRWEPIAQIDISVWNGQGDEADCVIIGVNKWPRCDCPDGYNQPYPPTPTDIYGDPL